MPTDLRVNLVLKTVISNLKRQNSPDPTGKNFPVVLKMYSDNFFEIPRSAFLFAPCWDKICSTQHLEEFRRQPSPSSRLWCEQIVSNLCVSSSRKIPTLASISSLSVVTPENDQLEQWFEMSFEQFLKATISRLLLLSSLSIEQSVPVILWKEHENAILLSCVAWDTPWEIFLKLG